MATIRTRRRVLVSGRAGQTLFFFALNRRPDATAFLLKVLESDFYPPMSHPVKIHSTLFKRLLYGGYVLVLLLKVAPFLLHTERVGCPADFPEAAACVEASLAPDCGEDDDCSDTGCEGCELCHAMPFMPAGAGICFKVLLHDSIPAVYSPSAPFGRAAETTCRGPPRGDLPT